MTTLDRIHEDARETILAWKNEFNDEPLNYEETEWLDQAFDTIPDEDDDIEVEAFESGVPRELFFKLFEDKVKAIR